ncbi:MAG: imidazole glycerol phosphate synthase subunit HisH [Chloroflexi bacterium CG08_land_8_20_14_0_20_45_12]|nr:MAG: imidazole glycerol phosphate synthase subunit HisH [Chloroflexi bacterium CG08_land_8_20_14_0_20_45_12]
MIAIIDYGAGNLRSVVNAISKLGYQAKVTSNPDEMLTAQAVILPGVGAAADTMANLKRLGLVSPIRHFIAEGRPFFGVCIGLQILFTVTEEGGWHECLDIIHGTVRRLPPGLKIPHMGWNQVKQKISHPIFSGIPDEADFYFVHSYHVEPNDRSLVAGETEYGVSICSVIAQGNLVATQFHPEKSGEVGLKIYDNFIKIALGAKVSRGRGL